MTLRYRVELGIHEEEDAPIRWLQIGFTEYDDYERALDTLEHNLSRYPNNPIRIVETISTVMLVRRGSRYSFNS